MSISRLSTWAWIETSSAATDSSRIRIRGSAASARRSPRAGAAHPKDCGAGHRAGGRRTPPAASARDPAPRAGIESPVQCHEHAHQRSRARTCAGPGAVYGSWKTIWTSLPRVRRVAGVARRGGCGLPAHRDRCRGRASSSTIIRDDPFLPSPTRRRSRASAGISRPKLDVIDGATQRAESLTSSLWPTGTCHAGTATAVMQPPRSSSARRQGTRRPSRRSATGGGAARGDRRRRRCSGRERARPAGASNRPTGEPGSGEAVQASSRGRGAAGRRCRDAAGLVQSSARRLPRRSARRT